MTDLPELAFRQTAEAALLSCRVQPGASRSTVVGPYGDEVKIALQAPPVDGKANAALCKLIADWCKLPKANVSLLAGAANRSKVIAVKGITADALKTILSNL